MGIAPRAFTAGSSLSGFEKSVPKAKRDPNLAEKLAAERDGILMWALTGLKRLIASGYVFSETERTRAELEKYRIESNSVCLSLNCTAWPRKKA